MAIGEKKPTGMALFGIVLGVSVAVMLQSIDATIAAVALPHMQGSLSASQDEITWVITSYITATAIMTSPAGWLAERFGLKRIMMLSIIGFTIASVFTGLAESLDQVVICRILQGAFGAPLIPLSQSVLLDAYEPKDQARGLAWWSVGSMLGPILGPNIGGWITDSWSWRWVFFINVPVGILSILLVGAFVKETRPHRSTLDWVGFATLSTFIGAFQLMIDRGSGQDWFDSREIVIEACVAGLALYTFAIHSVTTPAPFVDFRNLANRNFAIGTIFVSLLNLVITAALVLIPSFMQNLVGDPVGLVGSLMAPRSVGVAIVMYMVGRRGVRHDPRYMTLAGLACLTAATFGMTRWNLNVSTSEVMWNGLLQGTGTGLAFAAMQGVIFSDVPAERRNGAVQIFSLARNFGQSIGTSLATALLVRNIQVNHSAIAARLTPYNRALQTGTPAHFWNWHRLLGRTALDAEVTRQASAIAYYDDFILLMLVSLAVVPTIFLIRVQKRRVEPRAASEGYS